MIVELNTKCPCGAEVTFKVKKPAAFRPEVTKFSCHECESVFLAKTRIGDKDRGVDVELGIQNLSPKCEEILQKAIDDRGKEKPESNEPPESISPIESSDRETLTH